MIARFDFVYEEKKQGSTNGKAAARGILLKKGS